MKEHEFQQMLKRRDALVTEARQLTDTADGGRLEGDTLQRFETIEGEIEQINADEAKYRPIFEAAKNPKNLEDGDGARMAFPEHLERTDPWERSTSRLGLGDDVRSRAATAIERTDGMSDDAKERATVAVEKDRGVAEWAVETSRPAYARAFRKMVADPQFGAQLLDAEERDAAMAVRTLSRGMNLGSGGAGSFLVPTHLDPSVILTNSGTQNPFRQVSKVVTIAESTWNGVSSAGVTASWDTEGAEVSDDAPTLAQPTIDVHKAAAWVPFSIEAGEDIANLDTVVAELIADAKDRLESAAFVNGTGTNQPTGIVTALDGGAQELFTSTNSAVVVDDVYAIYEALGARWRDMATWIMNPVVIDKIRQLGSDQYQTRTTTLDERNFTQLVGRPVFESSDMESSLSTTTDTGIAVFGDMSNYVIVDRVGLSVELVPHTFATGNNRPDGGRGFYAHWRVGADAVNDSAVVLASNPNTAA